MNTRIFGVSVVMLAACSIGLPTAGAQTNAAAIAAELYLTPEALTVAGVAPSAADDVLSNVLAEEQMLIELASKRTEADVAGEALTLAAEALMNGDGNEALITAHAQASSALVQINNEVEDIQQSLRDAALDGVAPQAVAQLALWPQSIHFNVPPEFRALAFTQDQWLSIAVALRAEQRFLRLEAEYGAELPDEEQLSSEHATLLASIREDQAVITAAANLETQLDAMNAAFDQVE